MLHNKIYVRTQWEQLNNVLKSSLILPMNSMKVYTMKDVTVERPKVPKNDTTRRVVNVEPIRAYMDLNNYKPARHNAERAGRFRL